MMKSVKSAKICIMQIVSIAMICVLLFTGQFAHAERGFAIHFLDVGHADAAIVLCDREVLIIDGGNSADSSFVYSYLKNTLGLDHIDYMVATHPHEDHIGGLSGALNACSVGTVYSSASEYDSDCFASFKQYACLGGADLSIPNVGDHFTIGTAEAIFLALVRDYSDINDQSLILRIEYGGTSFLFMGDADAASERDLIDSGALLQSTLLKVGHHGSNSSSSYIFLREVLPKYAMISAGTNNQYGHPTDNVISRLNDVGAEIYRTDIHGTIICTSDGTNLDFQCSEDHKK